MPDQRRRGFRPVHLLAPLALVAVAVAVAVVVLNSDVTGGDDNDGQATSRQATETETTTTPDGQGRRQRRNYVVRPGDSFGSIAERTGVTVDQLERLNPEVDPQALVVGQRIKLRE
jgi:teichoic acid transport system ATP-binding protein